MGDARGGGDRSCGGVECRGADCDGGGDGGRFGAGVVRDGVWVEWGVGGVRILEGNHVCSTGGPAGVRTWRASR